MPTVNFTSLLGLALPTTGDLSGTWGDEVNNYITSYLDASVAGALTVNADTTLTKTTGSALGATSSQYAILIASGHSTNITITAPATSKSYLVVNKSGTYTVKIRGAGPTTGVTVAANKAAVVAWDGSDFALVASTDTISTTAANTFTATQTFNGTTATKAVQLLNAAETVNVLGAAPSSTQNFYVNSGSVQFANANTANNWTLNVAFSSGTTLNTAMLVGDSVTIAFLAQNGGTAYYQTGFNIDGASTTVKWLGGTAPSSGNTNSVDAYTFTIIKTASATYTVLGSQSRYA